MARAKIDTETYIKRAKDVHGDYYDYSKVEYKNMHIKVVISCPRHGEFLQQAQLHLKGSGCPECGKMKQKATLIEKYGVDNPMKNSSIAKKMSKTVRSKSFDEKEITLVKRQATNLERYGVSSVMHIESIVKKAQTAIYQNNDVIQMAQKRQATNLKRYGSKEFLASKYAREKIKATNELRYGGPAPMSAERVRAKTRQTVFERYGVHHVVYNPAVLKKIDRTKRLNGSYGQSKVENQLYERLCELFGKEDVVRQYRSDDYPFSCDFYVKSRDLYIEFNGLWTHGGHWFTVNDETVIDEWQKKDTDYYRNAIQVWTKSDVKKRQTAQENNLNYLVFWDNKLKDFELWMACGCPDGQDYFQEYSWLPKRTSLQPNQVNYFTGTNHNIHRYVKAYQFFEFYKHELELWQNRFMQMKLYLNRWQYIGKLPHEITDAEILRGFKISGLYRGYSVFNTSAMEKVLEKYPIQSVYDPCAGWGERMLCCHAHGMTYTGADVNAGLKTGYDALRQDLDLKKCQFKVGDSSVLSIAGSFDAVITCPPYGDTEIYSEKGAENLSDADFLEWWQRLVKKSFDAKIPYFCFQINQKWKDALAVIVAVVGYELVETIDLKPEVSHFNQNARQKKEYESMFVFKLVNRS